MTNTKNTSLKDSKVSILLTGESGMLGNQIKKGLSQHFNFIDTLSLKKFTNDFHFYNGKQVKDAEWDITNYENIQALVKDSAIDENTIIIHTAAYVNTDKCENFPYEATKSNVLGTQYLIELAQRKGCGFINFSTTAVFNPDSYMKAGGVFNEKCDIDPKTIYGLTKYNAEVAVKQALPDAITIKPVFIYGDAPYDNSSNLRKILDTVLNHKKPIPITLDKDILKNYMRVEYFYEMFEKIVLNYASVKGQDFIISKNPEQGKPFDEFLNDINSIVNERFADLDCRKFIILEPEKDYLKDHLGYSFNFYKNFPNFKFSGPTNNDRAGIEKTYYSILEMQKQA